jgi:hypothetical protein
VVSCSPALDAGGPASSSQSTSEQSASDSTSDAGSGDRATQESEPEPCSALDIELLGVSADALVCESGQSFQLGGANAQLVDLGMITANGGASVNATIGFVPAPETPITALLHVEDPHAEPLLLVPSSDAGCLAEGGACALSWDLPQSGYNTDPLGGFTIPQLWIEVSDGETQVVLWVLRIETPSR